MLLAIAGRAGWEVRLMKSDATDVTGTAETTGVTDAQDMTSSSDKEAAQMGVGGRPLTEKEILLGISVNYEILRELRARLPQSDWHAAFEAILRVSVYGRSDIEIRAEMEIGFAPPRAHFLVLKKGDGGAIPGDAFQLFRNTNVIEFKRPDESVNLRTIYKAIGYADLLVGNAQKKDDVPLDTVTVSIFHPGGAPLVLNKLKRFGAKVHVVFPGVYAVEGLTVFPLQIVAMGELVGNDNAKFRALTDKADKSDVVAVSSDVEKATGELRDLWRLYIKLVAEKNAGLFAELKEEDERMSNVLMDIMRDEVDELVRAAVAETAAETALATTKDHVESLMRSSGMGVREAMDALGVPEAMRDEVEALVGGGD